MSRETGPRERLAVALIIALAAARLIYALAFGPQAIDQGDAVDYRAIAGHLAEDGVFARVGDQATALRSPLYPALLALLRLLTGGEALGSLVALQGLLLTVAGAYIYRIARARYGIEGGLAALAIAALSPYHAFFQLRIYTEPLFLAALAPGLFYALEARRTGRPRSAMVAGALLGLATLTRPVTLFLPLVFLITTPSSGVSRGRLAAALLIPFVLTLGPWSLRNAVQVGPVLTTTTAGEVLWGANNPVVAEDPDRAGTWISPEEIPAERSAAYGSLPKPGAGELERDRAQRALAWSFLAARPGLWPWLAWRKLRWYWELFLVDPLQDAPLKDWVKGLLYKAFLPFLIAAFFLDRRRGLDWTLWWLLLYCQAIALLTYGSGRMRAPADPIWMALAGGALAELGARLRQRLRPIEAEARPGGLDEEAA